MDMNKLRNIAIPHGIKVVFFVAISGALAAVVSYLTKLVTVTPNDVKLVVAIAVINAILAGLKKYSE